MIELGKDNLDIAFICKANITRSPVMEQIMQAEVQKQGLTGITVASAGLIAPTHLYMNRRMRAALDKLGYPTVPHTPQKVTLELLLLQDLILCATEWQATIVLENFPDLEGRVSTLGRFATGVNADIRDPQDFIGHHPLHFISRLAPEVVKGRLYNMLGKIDSDDDSALLKIHLQTVLTIEKYCLQAIEKIKQAREQEAKESQAS